MIRIAWDKGFRKIYTRKVRNDALLKKRFWKAMELFSRNPFHPRLRTHKLSGKLEGLWVLTKMLQNATPCLAPSQRGGRGASLVNGRRESK